MVIGTIKNKSIADEVKIGFALIPLPTSDGKWIWMERYYVYDDTRALWRGRYSDYQNKKDFYYTRVRRAKQEMRFWVDDVRPAPEGFFTVKTVNDAIRMIKKARSEECRKYTKIAVLDLDHDAGDYADQGGDYIKILDWMEKEGINDIPVRFHSMNPVGVQNMRVIAERNNWKILY